MTYVRTVLCMKDVSEQFTSTRNVHIKGRRACCTVRDASVHLLIWVLTSIGVDMDVDFIGDDIAEIDPRSVTPSELLIAIQQLRKVGLDPVADEVGMIEVLLCAHLGQFDD